MTGAAMRLRGREKRPLQRRGLGCVCRGRGDDPAAPIPRPEARSEEPHPLRAYPLPATGERLFRIC